MADVTQLYSRWRSLKMWLPKMAALASIASAPFVHAHHGADPTSELPLWQMVVIAVVVLLGFVAMNAIRKWFEHRQPPPGNGRRKEEPMP